MWLVCLCTNVCVCDREFEPKIESFFSSSQRSWLEDNNYHKSNIKFENWPAEDILNTNLGKNNKNKLE
jgi:hypothetical protein